MWNLDFAVLEDVGSKASGLRMEGDLRFRMCTLDVDLESQVSDNARFKD